MLLCEYGVCMCETLRQRRFHACFRLASAIYTSLFVCLFFTFPCGMCGGETYPASSARFRRHVYVHLLRHILCFNLQSGSWVDVRGIALCDSSPHKELLDDKSKTYEEGG